MEAAQPSAPELAMPSVPVSVTETAEHERRCLTTGEILDKDQMVRFVVGPEDAVVPDLAQNLPGRGLWVKADFDAITQAAKKGLFAKAAKGKAKAAPDLADQVAKLLRARCLNFMGLAKGAGVSVLGQPQVEKELRDGKLSLLVIAADAKSELDSRQKVTIYTLFNREELGSALGYAQIVYAGFRPHGITKRLAAEIKRLQLVINTSPPSQEMDTVEL